MVNIEFFIVTYKNEDLLHRCIASIMTMSKPSHITLNINIINNHGTLCPLQRVTIHNNTIRPDFSTGHLARNWNQAILNAFKDPRHSATDLLILCQNDTMLHPHFMINILDLMRQYHYITIGAGDEVQVMNINAIEEVGLFDERFCNIGFQEADYFLRSKLILQDKACINDYRHGRLHNALSEEYIFDKLINQVTCGYERNDESSGASMIHHDISKQVFFYKWGNHIDPENWNETHDTIEQVPKQFMYYPYFERYLPKQENKYIIS